MNKSGRTDSLVSVAELRSSVRRHVTMAEDLFRKIEDRTREGHGVSRAPYGPKEQAAADILAAAAQQLRLDVTSDWAGNLYMSLKGTDLDAAPNLVGSHLDSVPRGGNFDGLAGIVAGLTAAAALQTEGIKLRRGLTVMGIRAEENAWFGAQHVGSRLALGTFDVALLDSARRIDTGLTLGEHIAQAGFDVEALRKGNPYLLPERVNAFIELHIEQGPVLESRQFPIGIVTGIRGNMRCADCICMGSYDHAGSVPKELRRDAVLATAELLVELDHLWSTWLDDGKDFVFTIGQICTDRNAHSLTTIPGEVRFSLDARSHSSEQLATFRSELLSLSEEIGRNRRVTFGFQNLTESPPALMDGTLRRQLIDGARRLGIPFLELPSGAGHDAADFALTGVPAAMIFVRNACGSHNPAESMRIDDFMVGAELLTWFLMHSD